MFSTKAYVTTANKKGFAPIYIRYSHKPEKGFVTFSLEMTVNPAQFDSKAGLMKPKAVNSTVINTKIRTYQQLIEDIAHRLVMPTQEKVKERFYIELEALKEKEAEEAKRKHDNEFDNKIDNLVNLIDFNQAVEQKHTLSKSLLEIEAELERLKGAGFEENATEEAEFKKYLSLYPNKFLSKSKLVQNQMNSWCKDLEKFGNKVPLRFSHLDEVFFQKYAEYYLHEKGCFNEYLTTQVKRLQTFVRYCVRHYKVDANMKFVEWEVPKDEPLVVYLTEEELDNLYHDFRERSGTTQARKELIDFTVLQNLTGLRFSDMVGSNWTIEDGVFIGLTEKNERYFQVPVRLDKRIFEILQRYDFTFYKRYASAAYNREVKKLLKDFFAAYKIHQEPIKYIKRKLTTPHTFYATKDELYASHCARRRFINHWVGRGFDDQMVMDILGSASLVELQRYKEKSKEQKKRSILNRLDALSKEKGIALEVF